MIPFKCICDYLWTADFKAYKQNTALHDSDFVSFISCTCLIHSTICIVGVKKA